MRWGKFNLSKFFHPKGFVGEEKIDVVVQFER